MEQETVKRKQLKRRFLVRISFMLVLSMIISTLVGYIYFSKIVREQKIADEKVKLHQVANQIDFITEDIDIFAKSIIVDDALQSSLEQKAFQTEFEQIKNKDIITKRLIFYNSLRTFIGATFIELGNGQRYSSSPNALGNDYLTRKFSTDEVNKYIGQREYAFSNPYYGIDTGNLQQVVCYRVDMWDKYNYGTQQGTLYIEVYLDHFLKQIRAYGQDYETVCLIGNNHDILYEQNNDGILQGVNEQRKLEIVEDTYKIGSGYLICQEIKSTGWKLYTLIKNDYLWERSKFVFEFFILSFMLTLILLLVSTSGILENIIRPITQLSNQLEHIDYDKLNLTEMVHTGDEIQTLYERFEDMLIEIRKGINQSMVYEKQKKDMEFDILLSQINPHYLYNVLNTVVYLAAAEKNSKIVNLVNSLIFTLQETLKLGEQNIETTIEKEIEFTRNYVNIQKIRYPDTFELNISCPQEIEQYIVPKTIIQPLVENAILHGILLMERKGKVDIRITEKNKTLFVAVEDDGIGISDENLMLFHKGEAIITEESTRKHIGISNVRDRIQYLYGAEYGMKIYKKNAGGTMILLQLPVIKK